MSEDKKTNGTTAEGGDRFSVMETILNEVKQDHIVTLTPCGLKLAVCDENGVRPVEGFDELDLPGKMYVAQALLQIHQDVFNKYRQVEVKSEATRGIPKTGGIIEATPSAKAMLAG